MNFTGVFINAFCVAVAGITGAFFRKGLPEKMKRTLMLALGLCVLYVGITGIVKGMDSVMLVLSVAIGVIIGEAIDFDAAFNKLGMYVERKLPSESGSVADGFVSATLFVCVGAMAIVGGIESGTKGTYSTFLAKSCIDALVVFIMAATKGFGCSLSALPVLIYEALITLFSGAIAQIATEEVINQMSVIGSLLIVGIALNLMEITKIKIGNFILAPFVPVVFYIAKIPFNN